MAEPCLFLRFHRSEQGGRGPRTHSALVGVETFPWSTESRDTTRELLDRRRMHLLRVKWAADGWQEIQQQIPAPQRCFRFRSYAQQIREESRTRPRRFRRGRKLPIPTSLLMMTGVSTRSWFILVCAVATKPSSAQLL